MKTGPKKVWWRLLSPLLSSPSFWISLETASQEEIVGVCRHQLMTRWQNREAKEHEGANDVSAIGPILGQSQNDVTALQFFLGVLQKCHESFLGTGLDETWWNLQVEAAPPQNTFPAPISSGRQFQNKRQSSRLLTRRFDQFRSNVLLLLNNFLAVGRELLLLFIVVIIPHTTMATTEALWRCRSYLIISGVGHIRTTTEAPPPASRRMAQPWPRA